MTRKISKISKSIIPAATESTGIRAGDTIIAATATENNLTLVTSNAKHFRGVKDLKLKIFRP